MLFKWRCISFSTALPEVIEILEFLKLCYSPNALFACGTIQSQTADLSVALPSQEKSFLARYSCRRNILITQLCGDKTVVQKRRRTQKKKKAGRSRGRTVPDAVKNSAVSPGESRGAILNRSSDGLESFLSAAGEPSHVANKNLQPLSGKKSNGKGASLFKVAPWMFICKKKKKNQLANRGTSWKGE